MKCPTCDYEFDPANGLECPRCGDSFSCAALSCGDCGACPTMVGSLRSMYARLTNGDEDPPAPTEVEGGSE